MAIKSKDDTGATILARRLTEQMLERMHSPKVGRIEYRDDGCRGLRLRVSDQGTKTFSVLYKVNGAGGVSASDRPLVGKSRRMSLGTWPTVKLQDARDAARKAIADATRGIDPSATRKQEVKTRQGNTFDKVLDRFIEREIKPSVESWRNVQRTLEIHALDRWQDWPVADIRRSHVHELLDDLVEDGKVGAAREVRKHLHRMFGWAVDREIVIANPVAGLKRGDLVSKDAGRSLEDEELRAVWRATEKLEYPFAPYFQLLILTGQRRGDWANSLWPELNREKRQLEIPAARYKSRRDHIVPLAPIAWGIVEALPALSENGPLFQASNSVTAISGFNSAKRQLDALALSALRSARKDEDAKLQDFRIHDFRVNCKTRLTTLGVSGEVRDAVVGHAKQGLERVYNKYDYLAEKRAALDLYARHVMEVVDAA